MACLPNVPTTWLLTSRLAPVLPQRDYWNNAANKRTRIKRTLVHMLSGQRANGVLGVETWHGGAAAAQSVMRRQPALHALSPELCFLGTPLLARAHWLQAPHTEAFSAIGIGLQTHPKAVPTMAMVRCCC